MVKSTKPISSRSFVVDRNRLALLDGGPERLAALVDLIDRARDSLRLLYYIYADDGAGRTVRAALERALDRGVTVALIIDGFGSTAPPEFFQSLHDRGGAVCRFLPHFGRRYLLRNHQKLALADERCAIIGGFNIEDAYFDDAGGWRDLGLRVTGPAVARLAGYFDTLQDWTRQDRPRLRDLRRALAQWSQTDPRRKARWLLGGPTRRLSPWAKELRSEISRAGAIDMIAAYFAPTLGMLRAIERSVRHGGKARIVTAARSDNEATIAAARHTYRRLLARGVRIFEYQRLKLHTKLYVIDDAVYLGSANFDVRSLFLNLEIMLRIEDAGFARHMRGYIDREINASHEITKAAHQAASWTERVRWSVAYWIVAVVDANVTRRLSFGIDAD